jgi:putative restriction endonuclease
MSSAEEIVDADQIYNGMCSVCGTALTSPDGRSEIEAAHIVPRRLAGSDDARNGLALCRRHHWAFDQGLFGVNHERAIVVPSQVRDIAANHLLAGLNGSLLHPAAPPNLGPHGSALQWHRENVLLL